MDTTPQAEDLWEGIGGHFDSFAQVICEFIDNSIGNFEANALPSKSINVRVEPLQKGRVLVSVEDSGTGIADFQPVMKLGDRSVQQSTRNEHGFGLKHALASGNPDNDNWRILTRTRDELDAGTYRELGAPFSFSMKQQDRRIAKKPWPGVFNGSGTYVEFECTDNLYYTLRKGLPGRPAGFAKCLDYLKEELGYTYAGVISAGLATINLQCPSHQYSQPVSAITPIWAGPYKPGKGSKKVDLGGGEIILEYEFGEMTEGPYSRYYKRNMDTSGVEIRINGRVMTNNLFEEIWGLEPHPSYNRFLAILNLVTPDITRLPKTRTSKNGIRSGDPKLEKLYDWIRQVHPTPPKDSASAASEKELVKELKELKEKHIRDPTKRLEQEFKVFTKVGSPVSADLYVYDGHDVVIYEAKKDKADVQNVYQLLMYWDGAVSDGLAPTEGIIIASAFSPGVDPILKEINGLKDHNGNPYRFSKRTWKEEGVEYPRP